MAFSEDGIWKPDISIYPGTSGGANAGLDFLNAFKSQQNADQAQAQQREMFLRLLYGDPNSQALVQNPDAATGARMTPDALAQNYAQTPGAQFRSGLSGASPDQRSDPAFIQDLGMTTGAMAPNIGMSAMLRSEDIERKRATAQASLKQRADAQRLKLFGEIAKLTPDASQAAFIANRVSGLSDDTLANLGDADLPVVAQRLALMKATAADRAAQGEKAQMQTSLAPALADSLITQRQAQAANATAGAGLKTAQTGQVGTETTRKTAMDLVKANQDIANLSKDKNFKLALAKGGDDKKKALSDLANLTATRDAIALSLRKRNTTTPSTTGGPPSKRDPKAPNGGYKMGDVSDDGLFVLTPTGWNPVAAQ